MTSTYLNQFEYKEKKFIEFFLPKTKEVSTHKSPETGFRSRAELGIFIKDSSLNYFMMKNGKKEVINNLEILHPEINELMKKLVILLKDKTILLDKLFSCNFKVTKAGESIICLNYHKEINEEWQKQAQEVAIILKTNLIGRSRKKKIVIGNNFIEERYDLENEILKVNLFENCFSQPNPYVCEKILKWTRDVKSHKDDILELHCGIGTFTLLLSKLYNQVLATENSRPSIKGLKENITFSSSTNISYGRLSGQETLEALNGKRIFRRLSDVDIDKLNIKSIFLDPPRSGLDDYTKKVLHKFDTIFYVSCGFESLKKDLLSLKSHKIKKASFFDQFPYTDHIESAVLLEKN